LGVNDCTDALGAALPQFLSFLAKLIGLDKIGNFVKKIWDALKTKIQKLIDKAIAKIQSKQRKPPKKRCKKCEKQGPGKKRPPKKAKGGSSISACGQCFVGDEWLRDGAGATLRFDQLRMGDRVATWWAGESGYAESLAVADSNIDPATHRRIWFTQEYDDGSWKRFGLLRSVAWIAEQGIEQVGDWVEVSGFEEMGVEGEFQVMAIDPCPVIKPGLGRIVTAEFQFSDGQIVELWIVGQEKPIRGTARHPFWSADRNDWVPMEELRAGERLLVVGGTAAVLSLTDGGVAPVFNIEVDGDHCYRVGERGVLVHNVSCPPATDEEARRQLRNNLGPSTAFPAHVSVQAHHIFPVNLFNSPLGEMLCCWGIDLNSAENGVWLPSCEYRGRVAALHSGGPPGWYNGYVQQEFANVTDKTSALIVIKRIRRELLSGNKQLNASAKPC
jgi:hypothetical protein